MLILVAHDTDEPALYGGMAAAASVRLGAGFAHLPARFDTGRFADAVQHATASGALVGSGLVWYERLTAQAVDRETTIEAVVARAAREDIVVPLHPAFTDGVGADLVARAVDAGVPFRHYEVVEDKASLLFRGTDTGQLDQRLGGWSRDAFGRLDDLAVDGFGVSDAKALRIGLVGAERDHRSAYPAALAALGDAAERSRLALDVVFIDPPALRAADIPGILAEVDGLLLPGGADMVNVLGQILMARGALHAKTPVVGLCLGMQTMATAVAQEVLGTAQANLAEADPGAPVKTFTAMAAKSSLAAHRLGERAMRIEPASSLAGCLGDVASVRFNHRFHFNLDLLPAVERGGLRVGAWDDTRQIVDAIEVEGHPFYIGLQGHPELSSRRGAPHPLIELFLTACRRRSPVGR